MKWIGERISFDDSSKMTTIVISPESNVLINVLMGAWLGMWYCVGFMVIWSLFNLELTEQESIILYVFLFFGCTTLFEFQNLTYGDYSVKN